MPNTAVSIPGGNSGPSVWPFTWWVAGIGIGWLRPGSASSGSIRWLLSRPNMVEAYEDPPSEAPQPGCCRERAVVALVVAHGWGPGRDGRRHPAGDVRTPGGHGQGRLLRSDREQ